MSRYSLALVVALAIPLAALAQDKAATPEFELRFVDGSVLFVSVAESNMEMTTKYGKLTVPLGDVKKIELGFHYPTGVEADVTALIKDLGSADFKARDAAQKRLIVLGEWAVPMVRDALKSGTPEVVQRAEAILKKLEEKLPREKLDVRDYDQVVTDEMTIRGKLLSTGFKAKSKYFGELPVNVVDLKEMRPVGGRADGRYTLDAAKYATQGWKAWLDTGIEVTNGAALEVTASGKIDQWVQTPGQYMSGPAGTGAQVAGPGGAMLEGGFGGLPAGAGGAAGGPGFAPGMGAVFQSGAVYAKIGEKGAFFKVGDSFKTTKTTATGRLYLIIAPSSWGNESAGEYEVKVKAGG